MVGKILQKQRCKIIIEDLRHRRKKYKEDAEKGKEDITFTVSFLLIRSLNQGQAAYSTSRKNLKEVVKWEGIYYFGYV